MVKAAPDKIQTMLKMHTYLIEGENSLFGHHWRTQGKQSITLKSDNQECILPLTKSVLWVTNI